MKVVIQCAAQKNPVAGCWQDKNDKSVMFVAHPEIASSAFNGIYAAPDDFSDQDETWRTQLLKYNRNPAVNPFNLYPAYKLYQNGTYQALVMKFGIEQIYILSAGWGLIRADFLTPQYDITFSASAEAYKRRKKNDRYGDFQMLPEGINEPVIFLGGKDYLPLFCSLTHHIKVRKILFYNSGISPQVQGFDAIQYQTNTRTNWHYECAKALMSDRSAVKAQLALHMSGLAPKEIDISNFLTKPPK
ncbi:MAG: hypothetical protein ABR955_15430 [Verrucomicrobiota bacterium]|jgi:hypothetical protein